MLIVGGDAWARQLASAMQGSGAAVRMWVGPAADREAARAAGIDADQGSMLLDAVNREAELEEVTDALLVTRSDDFNALAASELRNVLGHGHVLRVAPDPETADLLPPAVDAGLVGPAELTFAVLRERVSGGARILAVDAVAAGDVVLLGVSAEGRVERPTSGPGRSTVVLRG